MSILDIQGGTQPPAKEFIDKPKEGYVRLVQIRDFETESHLTFIPDRPSLKKCKETDVLIGRYGAAVGRICRGLSGAYNVALARVINDEEAVSQDFLYYLLKSDFFQKPLLASSGRSAQAGFNKGDLSVIELPVPPASDQKAIAHILGSLDDKTELNQKMNQTLEEIAKAIFKSWFVDFDPVRAKAEGRPTGLPSEISDLFPDKFVESEIGQIPKGWNVSPLSEFIVEVGKKTKPSPETVVRPYVPIDCISSKSLTLWDFKNGEEAKSSLVSFKKGDILFGAMRPYFHKVCITPFDGTTRTTCLVLSSKERDYFGFSLLTLFLDSTINFATQNSTGSTIPYIKWKNELESLTVPFPPVELAGQFNTFLEPILARFLMSIEEKQVLSELRDTLLPKLISGELRIPDAEKFLQEAGI